MCKILRVTRYAYFRLIKHPYCENALENVILAKVIRTSHDELHKAGSHSMNNILDREHNIYVKDRRVLRICRHEIIQLTIKYPANSFTKGGNHPYHIAENILNCEFTAESPNQNG